MVSRVSVIIPAFNAAPFLRAAIESVLSQSVTAQEVIVVDDGSSDATLSIAKSFGDRLAVFSRPHLGGSQALNFGIEKATGDTIAFLDADDLWTKDKLMLQTAALSQNANLEAVFGHVVQFFDEGSGDQPADSLEKHMQPGVIKSAMLIRMPALLRVGLFDPEFKTADFPEWYARAISLNLRSSMLPEIVLYRRIHGQNTSRIKRAELYSDYLKLAREAIRRGEKSS